MSRQGTKAVVDVELRYKIPQESAQLLQGTIKGFQSELGDKLGAASSKGLENINNRLQSLLNDIEKNGDKPLSVEKFKELNELLLNINTDYKELIGVMEKEVKLDVDTTEIQNKIDLQQEKVNKLKESLSVSDRVQTGKGMEGWRTEELGKKLRGSETFSSFDGLSQSLQIPEMRQGVKYFSTLKKNAEELINTYDQLMAKENDLTNQEQLKLNAMKDGSSRQKAEELLKLIKVVEDQGEVERKSFKSRKDEYLEEFKLLDELLLKLSEVYGADSPFGKARAAVEGVQRNTSETLSDTESSGSKSRDENIKLDFTDKLGQGMDQLVQRYFSVHAAIRMVQNMASKTIKTISDLDAAFVSIAVVTQYTNKEVWKMYDSFSNIAKQSGFTATEIAKVAGEYFRQGESYSNVLILTEAAAKAAKVAGIDAADSVRYLTSAVKGYGLAATDAMGVSDKFAALAASTATNYEGLATAMSKVASQASANGVEMDNLMGMMATAMEVTQEAPENIGTAFKTILARMSEIKDYGKVLEDGIDANRVEKALKTVNVALFDQNNEMRGLDTVLLEVGSKWGSLNKSQKAYLATTLAGTRQQTRLLAVLENMEMTEKNIKTSRDSAGATEAQQIKNTKSIEFAVNKLNNAYEQLTKNIAQSTTIRETISGIATIVDVFASSLESTTIKVGMATLALVGLGKALNITDKFDKFLSYIQNAGGLSKLLSTNFGILKDDLLSLKAKGDIATKSFVALNVAMKALTMIGLGIMIAGAAIKLAKFASSSERAKRQLEKLKETITELNAELYNLRNAKDSIEGLVNEFKELDRQIVKSADELKRMEEIQKSLSEIKVMGGTPDLFDMYNNIDYDKVNELYENIKKQDNELTEKRIKNNLKVYELSKKVNRTEKEDELVADADLSQVYKDAAIDYALAGKDISTEAIEALDKDLLKNLESVMKNSIEKRGDMIEELIETVEANEFNQDKYYAEYGQINTRDNNDGTIDVFKENEADFGFTRESIENLTQVNNLLKEGTIDLDQWYEKIYQIKDIGKDALESDSFVQDMIALAEVSGLAYDEIEKLRKLFNDLSQAGMKLTKDMQIEIAEAFKMDGAMGAIKKIRELTEAVDYTGVSFNQLQMNMIDVIDTMSQDDLVNALKGFDSLGERIDKINDSLKNFNAESLSETLNLLREYESQPEIMGKIADSILNLGYIDAETKSQMVANAQEKTIKEIEIEIRQNKARKEILLEQIDFLDQIIDDENLLMTLGSKVKGDISKETTAEMLKHMSGYLKGTDKGLKNLVDGYASAFKDIEKISSGDEGVVGKSSYTMSSDLASNFAASQEAERKAYEARLNAINQELKGRKEILNKEAANIDKINDIWGSVISGIKSDKWNAGFDATGKKVEDINKVGSAIDKLGDSVEDYISKLDALYIAQKKLELAKWGVDLIQAQEAYQKSVAEADGLDGIQTGLVDPAKPDYSEERYKAYEILKKQLMGVMEETVAAKKALIDGLNPALKGTYEIINGKIIPVMKKRDKLGNEERKQLDDLADKYNGLTEEIHGYTKEMYEAATAQNQILVERRNAVIEYHELMLRTIKNQENKELESFKKIIDANVKYLEERKKLYQESFEEEDEEKSIQDMEEKRREIIEKLANLESAHDLTSAQRKEMYLKELQDLNDDYNLLMLERNRDALLTSLDDQIEFQNETYQKEEEAYQNRITSNEWLEDRLKQIQDEARTDSLLKNYLHNMTIQEMLDHGYITQKEITEAGITDMNMKVNELNEDQQGVFSKYWEGNRDIIDKMWNEAEKGGVDLSTDAMDYILKYLTEHSEDMEETTELMRQAIQNEWKEMLEKVVDYTDAFNATELLGPDYTDLEITLDAIEKTIGDTDTVAHDLYNQISAGTVGPMAAVNALRAALQALSAQQIANKTFTVTQINRVVNEVETVSVPKKTGGIGAGGGVLQHAFATGGTTERTGLHWLDGKPGAPERVLSPGANEKFEDLLSTLTANHSSPQDNSDIVESLMIVVKAVYDSNQDSADEITKAIKDIELSDKGASIKSIANSHGISLNRRGDR